RGGRGVPVGVHVGQDAGRGRAAAAGGQPVGDELPARLGVAAVECAHRAEAAAGHDVVRVRRVDEDELVVPGLILPDVDVAAVVEQLAVEHRGEGRVGQVAGRVAPGLAAVGRAPEADGRAFGLVLAAQVGVDDGGRRRARVADAEADAADVAAGQGREGVRGV